MTSDIRDCPFCGESGRIERHEPHVFVGCVDLECHGGWCNHPYEAEAEAIAAWNHRANTPTDPRSEMVERVARGIYAARPFCMATTETTQGHQIAKSFDWDGAPAYYQEDMRQLARAAIAAMGTIASDGGETAEPVYREGYRNGFVDATITEDGYPDEKTILKRVSEVNLCEGWEACRDSILSTIPSSMPEMPTLLSAFRTTEFVGGRCSMVFSFRSIEEMHAADDEWHKLREVIEND